MAEAVLIARDLHKRFRQGRGEPEVLHGITLEVRAGEIVAIMGPSGAGKSTLLHILGLMEPASSGSLQLLGRDALTLPPAEKARFRNRRLGFLFQFHHLLPELTLLENVILPALILGRPAAEALRQGRALLDTMRLSPQAEQKPPTLSGGEQQRGALARALMNAPALLLADEPTGNLDKETGSIVLDLLTRGARTRGAAVLIVTHQDDIAARADRVLRLRDGQVQVA